MRPELLGIQGTCAKDRSSIQKMEDLFLLDRKFVGWNKKPRFVEKCIHILLVEKREQLGYNM